MLLLIKRLFSQKYKNEQDVKWVIREIVVVFTPGQLKALVSIVDGAVVTFEQSLWTTYKTSTAKYLPENTKLKISYLRDSWKSNCSQEQSVRHFSDLFDLHRNTPQLIFTHAAKACFLKYVNPASALVAICIGLIAIYKSIFG